MLHAKNLVFIMICFFVIIEANQEPQLNGTGLYFCIMAKVLNHSVVLPRFLFSMLNLCHTILAWTSHLTVVKTATTTKTT